MVNIGIYGNVNAGKSTFVNYLFGQDVAIVSDIEGTTTDVVKRRFELPKVGAVTFFDTAGFDDTSELGELRLQKTLETLESIDLAIIIDDGKCDDFLSYFSNIPYVVFKKGEFGNRESIFATIKSALPSSALVEAQFFGNLLQPGETVLLVCPIDNGAPSGRLILPQVQAIRAALDLHAHAIVVQKEELKEALERFSPSLIVTDSQIFDTVNELVCRYNQTKETKLNLTSFSILLADSKGDVEVYKKGLEILPKLGVGDRILIIEHCSHHASCDDIGRVKIPRLLNKYVGGDLEYTFVTGKDPLPENLKDFKFAIQCGGCMTVRRQILNRIAKLTQAGVAVTNYGLLLRNLLTLRKS